MNLERALKILEVTHTISVEDLKKQYRLLSLKFHPDRNKSANTTLIMAHINGAYQIIRHYIEKRDMPTQIWPQSIIINFGYGDNSTTAGNGFSWTATR